jgi:hypothetical protein
MLFKEIELKIHKGERKKKNPKKYLFSLFKGLLSRGRYVIKGKN